MKNELVETINKIVDVKNYVSNLSKEERKANILAIKVLNDVLNPELRAKEFEQLIGEEKFRTKILGLEMEMTSSPGTTTTKIVEKSIIDKEKAIQFAKEHNFEIPMTQRIVIEPTIDFAKLEDMEWFQNNIEQFKTIVKEEKTSKTYNTIRTKIVKK